MKEKYDIPNQPRIYNNANDVGCQVAIGAAALSEHKNFKHGAAITKGRRIISIGYNNNKTHPIYSKRFRHTLVDSLHAEIHSILKAHTDLSGCKIFVARKTKSGVGLSWPCKLCLFLIRESGIKAIVYTNNDNKWYIVKV